MPAKTIVKQGDRFGNLIIIEELSPKPMPSGRSCRMFYCECMCGKKREVFLSNLRNGSITCCGCSNRNHGESTSPLYYYWSSIKNRCKESFKDRKYYYDKGISVCKEWEKSFLAFKEWALNNGYDKTLQIDRKDNSKGYGPDNCRFVTSSVNMLNRDITKMTYFDGEYIPLIEASRKFGLSDDQYLTVLARVGKGMTGEDAIKKPIKRGKTVKDLDTGIIYPTLKSAAEALGVNYTCLSNIINKTRRTNSSINIIYI